MPYFPPPIIDPDLVHQLPAREQLLINGLQAIIQHQTLVGGSLSELSTTRTIAEQALKAWKEKYSP